MIIRSRCKENRKENLIAKECISLPVIATNGLFKIGLASDNNLPLSSIQCLPLQFKCD